MKDDKRIYEIFIRTTPETLWRALIVGSFTEKYLFNTKVETSARPGERIVYTNPDGTVAVDGKVLESEPLSKLMYTWVAHWDKEIAKESSTVTWLIEKRADVCKLSIIHDVSMAPITAGMTAVDGWSVVLSGLKTLLETGEPLVIEMTRAA
jgi:uncharacterized protein YndB with AHSA1/START domain